MPSYKLIYFNSRGLAEVSRLLFAAAGQEYEDFRFTQETWPQVKPTTPFGQAPVLEIDGKQYGQSSAIARYLARTFGMYGKNNTEALEIDQVLGIIQDIMFLLIKLYYETDEGRKADILKDAQEEKIPMYFNMFDSILQANGSTGYFVGDKLSLADITVFNIVDLLQLYIGQDPVETFPLVKKSVELVGAEPKIKAWLEKRPKTTT